MLPILRAKWEAFGLDELLDADPLGWLRRAAQRVHEADPGVSVEEFLAFGLLMLASRAIAGRLFDDAPASLVPTGFGAAFGELLRGEALRDVVLLRLHNENPAASRLAALIDDATLASHGLVAEITEWVATQPRLPGLNCSLTEALAEPIEVHPESLAAQLDFAVERWRMLLPEWLWLALCRGGDLIREATTLRGGGPGPELGFAPGFGGAGAPAFGEGEPLSVDAVAPVFAQAEAETERFSADRDWMSNVVLMAKSTYVWLDQLSRIHQREITRLDQIPNEALDELAEWGFTGLWLIGVWERSSASAEIKRRMGNPDALASAYALYDDVIAADLGGAEALANLSERALERGIKLCGDMVPNHTGIYSRWVMQHPDWFVQLREPPYEGYRFTGPDICPEPRVGLFLEDGYWRQTDAAVVFRRVDYETGDVRYIYHGNDGTQMPWNDTAQIDFLNPEAREAVIRTILHVSRMFPIIRFDAAMTLARRHVRRLWHPRPGEGGAIPSRSEQGLDEAAFDAAMPREFWQDVVKKIGDEQPDTLLLAEAFWQMEGYFVRTLGMHRVYNSAFMNMLKMEENAKYRRMVRDVIDFSPEVLKRFVNFMNNPDERTAIDQFGHDDKYFGIATLMVTLPGLPMFGHGQVEGFTEKYGMEYRRARHEETPDRGLVARHEAEIFPLMRERHLYSQAENFAFFDFVSGGTTNENVFAYSNRAGPDRALVVVNNAYQQTDGHVGGAGALAGALGLGTVGGEDGGSRCLRLYERRSRLFYLYRVGELAERGLPVRLRGYQALVFTDLCASTDEAQAELADWLDGIGAPDLEHARTAQLFEGALADPEAGFGAYCGRLNAAVAVPDTWPTDRSLRGAAILRLVPETDAFIDEAFGEDARLVRVLAALPDAPPSTT